MGLFDRLFGSDTSTTRAPVARGSAGMVERDNTPLWLARGWRRSGETYTGPYAVKGLGTWPGSIQRRGDTFLVLIHDPPQEMRRHPKWGCVHPHSGGWQYIHLAVPPADRDVSSVIYFVEKMLADSFAIAGKL